MNCLTSKSCAKRALLLWLLWLIAPARLGAESSGELTWAAEDDCSPEFLVSDVAHEVSREESGKVAPELRQPLTLTPEAIGGSEDAGTDGEVYGAVTTSAGKPDREACERGCCEWERSRWLGCLRLGAPAGRYTGDGGPLEGTSWLNRPYHADWFVGVLFGDDLIDRRVDQENDVFSGLRFGWDWDHYWGTELRMGWAAVAVSDRQVSPQPRSSEIFQADISAAYYPWGDSRWRPYLLAGLGIGNFDFVDDAGDRRDTTLLGLPFGVGVKYLLRQWLALRAELLDNVAFADSGLNSMHNISLTVGAEWRFGAEPPSYWPWNPSAHVW